MNRRRAIVYIDGFNLYYGALKGTPHRWLDISQLSARLLPADEIGAIKYFTARVKPRPDKPHTAQRQQIYLRALETLPGVSVHEGHFLTHPVTRRLVEKPGRGSPYAKVWHTEEKGSDVNIATHLLVDGFRDRYDLAVVISNDSDLKEPVRIVREELKTPVGILNPHSKRSYALSPNSLPAGSFYKPIRQGVLRDSQLPETLEDAAGRFSKPKGW